MAAQGRTNTTTTSTATGRTGTTAATSPWGSGVYTTYDEANQWSVPGYQPVPLGGGQWVPGGYTRMGNQWVRPQSAPPIVTNAGTGGTGGAGTGTGTTGDLPGVLPGWDQTKWTDTSHDTTKYQVGRILAKYPATTAGLQQAWQEIAALYPNAQLQNDKIVGLPGTLGPVDVLVNSAGGGSGWWWGDTGVTGGGTDGTAAGGAGNGLGGYTDINSLLNAFGTPGGPFSIASSYLDPDTRALLDFVRSRVQTLTTPTLDPAMEAYISSARGYADQLATPWENPESANTMATLRGILEQISGAPFTDTQSAALKAEAYDGLEQDRDAATRRAIASMAALGHGRESGTIADVLSEVNRGYDANRADLNRGILIKGIDQTNRNRDQSVTISDLLRQIPMQDFSFNEARGAQSVGALNEVANARARQRAENEQRQATALALSSIPVQLADSRLQTALQVLGMSQGVNPTNIFNSLSSLLSSTQANTLAQSQQNSNLWLGIGQILGQLPWDGLSGGGA